MVKYLSTYSNALWSTKIARTIIDYLTRLYVKCGMKLDVFECWNDACSVCQCKDEIIWICKNEHNVVMGKMICVKETNDILHLTMIETDPGKGIGKTLINALMIYCEMNDITHVYLYPHLDAVVFFEKLGFCHLSCNDDAKFIRYLLGLHDSELMSRIMYKTIKSNVKQNLMT